MTASEFSEKMHRLVALSKKNLQAAQDRYKHYADTKRTDIELRVGQQVLLSTRNLALKDLGTKKFLPKFIGPFAITRIVNKVAYELKLPDHYKIHNVFHVSLLKEYKPDRNTTPPPPPVLVDGDLEYEVEKVMAHRDKGRKKIREYLLRFKGYGPADDLWLPVANLNCPELIEQYWTDLSNQHSQDKKRSRQQKPPASSPPRKRNKHT